MSNIKRNLDDIVTDCGEIGSKINPNQTKDTIALHLLSEVIELIKVIGVSDIETIAYTVHEAWAKEKDSTIPKELADVAILTYNFAWFANIDLAVWVHIVNVDNRTRKWGKANKVTGFVEHLKIVDGQG